MKKKSKKILILVIIIAAILAAIVIAYFIGRGRYQDHFFQGTNINGWDCSGETVEDVKDNLQKEVLKYSLTIKERGDKTETITGEDLGLLYEDKGEVDEIMNNQDADLWFMHMSEKNYSVGTAFTFDEKKLDELVGNLDCVQAQNMEEPENAYVTREGMGFLIVPEKQGSKLDKKAVRKAVEEAIRNSDTLLDLEAKDMYAKPEILSDNADLAAKLEAINLMLSSNVVYDFADRTMAVNGDTIIDWIVDDGAGNFVLNRDAVYAWVVNMAYETDTFGLSHPFVTSYGVEITLEGGGDYGWCIDKDSTTDYLYEYIRTGQNAMVQPQYLYTGMDRSTYDIGNTYVEVCITTQTLWCYKDGQLLTTTPIISGNEATGFNTPSGSVWAIDAKKTDWKFTHFANAYSNYWMPFNDECGIHDASWQAPETYVVDTYKLHGSHGCLNTPDAPMEIIYNNMEIGYPVVVYYSLDQIVGPAPTQDLISG